MNSKMLIGIGSGLLGGMLGASLFSCIAIALGIYMIGLALVSDRR
jgi:hypothetical protein